MKKTLTINLNGRVFNIDEDACNLLDNYLKNLETYFSKQADSSEIMNDFEARIGEIFSEKIAQGYDVININDVEQIITQMGNTSDFDENNGQESAFGYFAANEQDSKNNSQNASAKQQKKLFRDIDNKMLGGICSGIAAYFNWDVTVIRIIVVLLSIFSNFSLLILYLIMWLLIPEARTAEQKLQMRGEPVNLENIGKTVAAQTNNAINKVQNNGCAGTFLKVCLIIIGLPFFIVLVTLIFALTVVLLATLLGVSAGIFDVLIPLADNTFLFVQHPVIAIAGLCLLIGIPIGALLYWICQKIFHWGKIHTSIKIIVLLVWLASMVMLPFAGWKVDWGNLKNNIHIDTFEVVY